MLAGPGPLSHRPVWMTLQTPDPGVDPAVLDGTDEAS